MFKNIKILNFGKFKKIKIEYVNLFYLLFEGLLI